MDSVNSPLLFGWPSALKADIKASQWAFGNGKTKEAVDRASIAWLAIQLLSPDSLEPDPNLKLLKVADAISLRRRLMEERQRAMGKSGPKPAISISKEEREYVINLHPALSSSYLRLSRVRGAVSGDPLNRSLPLDAEPLIAVFSELGLESRRDIFAGLDGDEICHESPSWQDILLTQITVKITGSERNLISKTAALMGDLCEKLGYHGPAYVFHMSAA
ncbi:hypothetical protein ACEPAF_1261 [Sanghuangporus sanghuang]